MKGFFGSNPGKTAGTVDTLIGRQTEILGDIRFGGGLHIDGTVKGRISGQPDKACGLWVSETGVIEGDVVVPNVTLNGTVNGDVHASEQLTLGARAKVTGNVYYKTLQMEPGAMVNGQLLWDDGGAKPALTHERGAGSKPQDAVTLKNEGREHN